MYLSDPLSVSDSFVNNKNNFIALVNSSTRKPDSHSTVEQQIWNGTFACKRDLVVNWNKELLSVDRETLKDQTAKAGAVKRDCNGFMIGYRGRLQQNIDTIIVRNAACSFPGREVVSI